MTESSRPFVAFISYSHRDTQWAAWIQKAVERYRLPNALAKETGLDKRIGKVFRDREELATGQNLGDHLLEALDNSDNLIVICSPNAVNSQWVGQEIEYFKKIGRGDRIFCLLVEGGAESLPAPLLTDVEGNPLEPLAADPREDGDGKRLAKLKLISGILGVKLDQLTRREQARQNQLRAIYTSIAGLFVFMGAAAFVSYQQQQLAKEREAFERENAMANAANMVEFAESIANQIDMESRAKVNDQLIEYLERSGTENLDIDTMRYLAQAYQQLGIAKLEQGTDEENIVDSVAADQAVVDLRRSADLFESIVSVVGSDPEARFDLAVAYFYRGYSHLRRGEFESAESPFNTYAAIISDLYKEDDDNPDHIFEYAASRQALLRLSLQSETGFSEALKGHVEAAVAASRAAVEKLPEYPEMHDALSVVMNMASGALEKECLYGNPKILEYRRAAVDSAEVAFSLRPRDRGAKSALADMYNNLAHTHDVLGDEEAAWAAALQAYRLRLELADSDPTNSFAASQVIKSRLDIYRLKTHAKTIGDDSFTATQALTGLEGNAGRSLAKQTGLLEVWLLYTAENAMLMKDLEKLRLLISDFDETGSLDNAEPTEAKYMTYLMIKTLQSGLNSEAKFSSQTFESDTFIGKDCRSKVSKWLWQVNFGDRLVASSELAELRRKNFNPKYLDLYEGLSQ
jgi:tetratricopeptide (TPR) repeat protein